jgi:hypothetical protein
MASTGPLGTERSHEVTLEGDPNTRESSARFHAFLSSKSGGSRSRLGAQGLQGHPSGPGWCSGHGHVGEHPCHFSTLSAPQDVVKVVPYGVPLYAEFKPPHRVASGNGTLTESPTRGNDVRTLTQGESRGRSPLTGYPLSASLQGTMPTCRVCFSSPTSRDIAPYPVAEAAYSGDIT